MNVSLNDTVKLQAPNNKKKGKTSPKKRPAGQRYTAPIAASRRFATRSARDTPSKGGRTIAHREYIGAIVGTGGQYLTRLGYSLNPGNSQLFPWLATIALKYELYRFTSLRFVYIPRCASTVPGSVILSPEYDPEDDPPQSLQQALTAQNSVETSAWKEVTCSLDIKSMHALTPHKYTRVVDVAAPDQFGSVIQDPNASKYDCGRMFIATSNNGGDVALGHLWVEYKVQLKTPQLEPTISDDLNGKITIYEQVSDVTLTETKNTPGELPPGLSPVPVVDELGLGVLTGLGGVPLKPGRYDVFWQVNTDGAPDTTSGQRCGLFTEACLVDQDGPTNVTLGRSADSAEGDTYQSVGLFAAAGMGITITITTPKTIYPFLRYAWQRLAGSAAMPLLKSYGARLGITRVSGPGS